MLFNNKKDNTTPKPSMFNKEERMRRKEEKRIRKAEKRENSKVRRWFKNFGKSSKEMIVDWLENQRFFVLVNDELRYVEDVMEERKRNKELKITPMNQLKNYTDEKKKKILSDLNERYQSSSDDDQADIVKDIKGHFNAMKKGVKSGDLNEKYGSDAFLDDEDIAFLFNDDFDWDEFDSYEESYNFYKIYKGGKEMSMYKFKDKTLERLRITGSGESLSIITDKFPMLNRRINEMKNKILAFNEDCELLDCNVFINTQMDDSYSDLKKDVLEIIKGVSTNGLVEEMYAEPLSDLIVSTLVTRCVRKKDEGCNKHEIKSNIIEMKDEVAQHDVAVVEKIIEKRLDELGDSIDTTIDSVDYEPETNEQNEDLLKYGADLREHTPAGEIADFAINSALDLFQVLFALPINLAHIRKIDEVENKYGSNFVARQPMVVSDNMSKDLAGKYSKALEIKYLLETKSVLEATAARADGGVVMSRVGKNIKYLNPANIKFKDVKLYDNTRVSYNEIIGAFSENANPLGHFSSDLLFLLPSMRSTVCRNFDEFMLMRNMAEKGLLTGRGEASGDFISHGRDALPSYIEVTIEYIASKNVTNFNIENKSRSTLIGMQITPRSIPGVDIVDTLAEMDKDRFKEVKTTPEEKGFVKKMRNLLKFWKKKGNPKELKVLKSNQLSSIVSKIEHIETPLFHIVITMDEYTELKNRYGMDLMNAGTYRKLMQALPLISLSIIDEDTNRLYFSEGPVMNYSHNDLDAYIDTLAQYEKDLKTLIKYNQYR